MIKTSGYIKKKYIKIFLNNNLEILNSNIEITRWIKYVIMLA